MAYLTYDDWKENYSHELDLKESEFDRLSKRSVTALNNLTNGYYECRSFSQDLPFRQNAFKEALALTIEHLHQTGAETQAELEALNLTSVIIGGTHLNMGTQDKVKVSLVPHEAQQLLQRYGFMYRAVRY